MASQCNRQGNPLYFPSKQPSHRDEVKRLHLTAEQQVAALQQRYLGAVYDRLHHVVPQDADGTYPMLRYHLGWEEADGTPSSTSGGKALRPVLCLMACEMAGGDWHQALPAAAALELVHNFSLLHDDIQDRDITRRGRATAWTIWGIPQAVVAGNAMRVAADRSLTQLADSGLSAPTTIAASRMLTQRYMEMIEGQYLDMSFEESGEVTTAQYLDMIGRKTGALIQSAMYMGALIATGDTRSAEAIGQCGRGLGLAFQVWDDYLGIWGDPAVFGKPVGSDIARKKKSLPVVHVFQQIRGADRQRLLQIYSAPEIQGADVETVMAMMAEAGTDRYVREIALT